MLRDLSKRFLGERSSSVAAGHRRSICKPTRPPAVHCSDWFADSFFMVSAVLSSPADPTLQELGQKWGDQLASVLGSEDDCHVQHNRRRQTASPAKRQLLESL
jgi:hypothetical protein